MKKRMDLWKDTRGYAVVEATILFPVITLIFLGFLMLAIYLPTRANLQRATQYAATALATTQSDTWLTFNPDTLQYSWVKDKGDLPNVYVQALFSLLGRDSGDDARTIVSNVEQKGVLNLDSKDLEVSYQVVNCFVYKEIVITATRKIEMPINLSLVGLPNEFDITVTSTAVVQNGDEFIRNIDLAGDMIVFLGEKLGIDMDGLFGKVQEAIGKVNGFLGV